MREIGRKYNIDHKSIASLLRRLGVKIEKRMVNGEKHSHAKLNVEKVRKIKVLLTNVSIIKIASEFEVNPATIYDIKKGKTWTKI